MGGLDSGVYSSAHNRSHHSSHGQDREASPSERLIVGVTVRREKALDSERKRLIASTDCERARLLSDREYANTPTISAGPHRRAPLRRSDLRLLPFEAGTSLKVHCYGVISNT